MPLRILPLGLILGVLALPAWAGEASRHGMGRSIAVQGQGVVTARPDMAVIQAGVTTQAANAKAALAGHHEVMSKLMAELEKFGLAARDVQSRQVNLRAIFPPRRDRDTVPVPSAFRATGNVAIRLREVDRLGDLLEHMTAARANNISGLRFTIAAPEPLQDQARKLAIQDARRRAQLYALEAGVQLGEVLRIREGGVAAPMREVRAMAASQGPMAPGESEIRIGVSVVFAIK